MSEPLTLLTPIEEVLYLTSKEAKYLERLLKMRGDEIYQKYGLKRDETITHTVRFEDDVEMDIKLVICGQSDTPYTEAILFEDGCEVGCTDPDDTFVQRWSIDHEGKEYVVDVGIE